MQMIFYIFYIHRSDDNLQEIIENRNRSIHQHLGMHGELGREDSNNLDNEHNWERQRQQEDADVILQKTGG